MSPMPNKPKYNEEILAYIKENYAKGNPEKIAKHCGMTLKNLYTLASNHGIKRRNMKPKESASVQVERQQVKKMNQTRHGVIVIDGNSRVHTMR